MCARLAMTAVLAGAAMLGSGCQQLGAILFLTSPQQIQKTEFKLTKDRLAILIDYARPADENPVFTRSLHEKLVEVFRDRKINDQVVPLGEMQELRQTHPDFPRWSVQRVARELFATQVLWVRVERLTVRSASEHPLIEPGADLRLRVIGRDEPSDKPRLWPGAEERDGRAVQRNRQPKEATDPVTIDSEAAKLGKDIALLVARPFYDVDLEETVPWEP